MRLDGVGPQDGLKGGSRVALDHLRSCREHILCTDRHTGHPCTTHEVLRYVRECPLERCSSDCRGQPLQQACALSSLPELFKKHQKDCLYRVLPLICVSGMHPLLASPSLATILSSSVSQPIPCHHFVILC